MLDLFIIALMTAIFGALLFGYQAARKKGKEIVQEKNKFEVSTRFSLRPVAQVAQVDDFVILTEEKFLASLR
jgi:hypothetical protein